MAMLTGWRQPGSGAFTARRRAREPSAAPVSRRKWIPQAATSARLAPDLAALRSGARFLHPLSCMRFDAGRGLPHVA
jgi:hypothetical protein